MRGRDDFPALDGLRAVGAYGVLLTHAAFQTGQYPRGLTGALLARLDFGVALFFVLSGFLLSLGFLRPVAERRPHQPWRRYALKRVLRIWPAFAVAVVAAMVVIGSDRSGSSWALSLTLTHLYSTEFFTDGLTQMWSLETEAAFYLALPFIVIVIRLLTRRRWSAARVYGVALALAVINWCWLGFGAALVVPHRPFAYQWLPAYTAWFGAGIALAVLWIESTRDGRRPPKLVRVAAGSPGVLWAIAFCLLLFCSTPLAGPLDLTPATEATAIFKNVLYGLGAVLIMLPGVFGPRGTTYDSVFSSRPVRYLGHLSYSVFCIHLVVLWLVLDVTDTPLFSGDFLPVAGLTLVGSTAAAVVLHHLVERPAMRLSHRRSSGDRAWETTSTSTPSPTS